MADSVGEEANGSVGSSVGTGQGHGTQLLSPSSGNSIPGNSSASPHPAEAAETGLAVIGPWVAHTVTPAAVSGLGVLSHAIDPTAAVPLSLPPGIGLAVPGGAPNLAGAGLLSQIHATSWDPTLSTDWDNEKASQQCILRIKR